MLAYSLYSPTYRSHPALAGENKILCFIGPAPRPDNRLAVVLCSFCVDWLLNKADQACPSVTVQDRVQ